MKTAVVYRVTTDGPTITAREFIGWSLSKRKHALLEAIHDLLPW